MTVAALIPPGLPRPGLSGTEGVHLVMRRLCRQLSEHGHQIRLVLPQWGSWWPQPYPTVRLPMTQAGSLEAARRDAGKPWVDKLAGKIARALSGCHTCFVYDTVFDVYCLPLLKALRRGARQAGCRLVFYTFESTWPASMPGGFDWSLVEREPWREIAAAAEQDVIAFPAQATRDKTAELTGLPLREWALLPPMMHLGDEPHLSAPVLELWHRLGLFGADVVLFLPALNRDNNNIDKAVRVTAELRALGVRPRLLLTYGRKGSWRGNRAHYDGLLNLTAELGLRREVVFLSALRREWARGLSRHELQTVYQLCDLVLLPTSWEGFGLVAAEAALARAPLLCTDLPVLREVTGDAAEYFDLDCDDTALAKRVLEIQQSPAARLRRAAHKYVDLGGHYRRHLQPLLDGNI